MLIITDDRLRDTAQKVFHGLRKCELRFMHEPLPSSTLIYGSKVVTLLFGEKPTAFVIDSKQHHEQYKKFFLTLWEKAKKQ